MHGTPLQTRLDLLVGFTRLLAKFTTKLYVY